MERNLWLRLLSFSLRNYLFNYLFFLKKGGVLKKIFIILKRILYLSTSIGRSVSLNGFQRAGII